MSESKTKTNFVPGSVSLNEGVNLRSGVVPLNSQLGMEGFNLRVNPQPSRPRPTKPPVSPQIKNRKQS